jgi:hypothetical protein
MTDLATHAWSGELAAQRDGFAVLDEVTALRDAGESGTLVYWLHRRPLAW